MQTNKAISSDNGLPLDQRLLELSALFEMCQTLTSSLTLGSVLENVLRIPMGYFLITKGIVLLDGGQNREFVVEGLKGLPRELIHKTLRVAEPPSHSVLIKPHQGQEEWVSFFRQFGIEIVLPLGTSRNVIGLLGFGERIGQKPFGEREIEFLNSLSGIAATAVSNGLMVSEIQKINQQLDRKVQQLNTIFDIGRELNSTLDIQTIGSILSFAVMGELMVNKCAVLVGDGNRLKTLVAKGMPALPPFDALLLQLGKPEILENGRSFPILKQAGISVLVPMRIHDETRGVLAVGPKLSNSAFTDYDLEFLDTLGNQAMSSLENARLFQEALEKQRMEEELRFAQNIQQDLLPKTMPVLDGMQIAAVNIPSREVGGDYFDVIRLSENLYGIAVADVAGKGAGAALLMANLQASLRALARADFPIKDLVFRINNLIHQNTALDKFITFFYGLLDENRLTFTFCNAGHNPPFRISKTGEVTSLEKGGVILGMMANMPFETDSIQLNSGDRIILYTDGISEAVNVKNEEFGVERILDAVSRNSEASASDLLKAILNNVIQFRGDTYQNDDMTLVVMVVQS
jgi:sigma-B regulation protein RsbU (phosphoserine phosphatase)